MFVRGAGDNAIVGPEVGVPVPCTFVGCGEDTRAFKNRTKPIVTSILFIEKDAPLRLERRLVQITCSALRSTRQLHPHPQYFRHAPRLSRTAAR